MKQDFNWNQLHLDKCPVLLCDGELVIATNGERYFCNNPSCDFFINTKKLLDIKSGKRSEKYKNKIKKFKKIADYKAQQKTKLDKALQAQEQERQYNLRKMNR